MEASLGFLDLSQVFNGKLEGALFGFVTKLACDLLATLEKSHLHSAAVLILSFSPRLQPLIPLPIRKSPFAETRFHDDQILARLPTGYCELPTEPPLELRVGNIMKRPGERASSETDRW